MNIYADKIIALRTDKTVFRDGQKVIKVFDSDYSKSRILSEALNQSLVEEAGVKVPSVLEVAKLDGKWAIISEYIKGKTLQELMMTNPEKKDEYLTLFVDIQHSMHQNIVPNLVKLRDKMSEKIGKSDFDATIRYELFTRLEALPKSKNLYHGDFFPNNIIISDSGEAYILDWPRAAQGDGVADAARTYLLFWLEGDISGAEKYVDLYCKKAGITQQLVQKWLPIVAAAQSTKGREKEREFLKTWVNVVDYN